jgi:hypothetical protein
MKTINKQMLAGIISFLMIVGIATAGILDANKSIIISEKPTAVKGNITFEVLNEEGEYSCYIHESTGSSVDKNDIETCAKDIGIVVGKELTNIKDWNNNCLKEDGNWSGC